LSPAQASHKNLDELLALDVAQLLMPTVPFRRARMRMKLPRFDSESAGLFRFEKSRERLHAKNVDEVSVLCSGWRRARSKGGIEKIR